MRVKILIKDNLINYKVSGVGTPLVFLHGWGCDLHIFDKIVAQINEDFTVYQIDLPGFGESEINTEYSIEEYASIINLFCLMLDINNPCIVGHSFGGRVAIKYASLYKVNKLVLVASPGIKEKFSIIKWSKIKIYKILKRLNMHSKMGSKDYKNATGYLKNVLVKAINLDLTNDISAIKTPTLLIYGKKDKSVPLYIGKKINGLITGSGLVVIDSGHFPFIEKYRHFLIVLKSFLIGNEL